ncbi:PREDICTED: kinesin-like protein KIF3B isoform X2 [Populus euphratica]|uniref:Kinesin-like protein KIN-10A n=1 Tax=Populus euphratica TaxID=75702 RepID=A0AAJ6UJR4_POPEU|nr:PREDICTED: kinesin-like protein KIF3B isoform X2 [Populus euphratica]
MAPTPSSSSSKSNHPHVLKTPQSKHRINFSSTRTPNPNPSPNPNYTIKEIPQDHPVEVISRIRDYPERKEKPTSILQVNPENNTLRVRADIGYRDFSFDGVSFSEEEDLDSFYKKFVESRINGVKLGAKCTIMMYGPTGSGKSHTMFGCSKQPGIVYRSLKGILGEGEEGREGGEGEKRQLGTFVQVTVLEIYNEEIYDLLSTNGGGGIGIGWPKSGSGYKVRLEVMGKKAKNATFISGNEAGKISKEIQKVEKRRIIKSTLCNERSSRSHCMIILDVPTVGGRLMLVDMAGSENIDQAGQSGFEAKMQTAKINQGNIALKRVVESIANGDSHVPFRDSKLTMLLQDSFEDDKSKILMILCASPDPKEIHKTICTLEYGAKAKCIVRGPHTPIKDKLGAEDSSVGILGSRIAAMDQFIYKLQMENKLREKERNDAHKQLRKKEEEVAVLRALIEEKGSQASEEEINLKVNERTEILKLQLEKKLEECQRMAEEFVEMERRRMEEKILQQQQEVEMLRRRLQEIEFELCCSRDENGPRDIDGCSFARRLLGVYADEDPGMVKSMDLDMGDQEAFVRDVRFVSTSADQSSIIGTQSLSSYPHVSTLNQVVDHGDKVCLSTVFEEEEVEEEEEHKNKVEDEEVEKEVIEVTRVVDVSSPGINFVAGSLISSPLKLEALKDGSEDRHSVSGPLNEYENVKDRHSVSGPANEYENVKDSASSRRLRIQNIFTLCGNNRELCQQFRTPIPAKRRVADTDPQTSPIMTVGKDSTQKISNKGNSPLQKNVPVIECGKNLSDMMALASKENYNPSVKITDSQIEVHVKWEASKGNSGKFITTLKVLKDATLADLRKLIEIYLAADNQAFTFLVLGDPTGAPVPKEKESTVQVIKLPICNYQSHGYLACLRPAKETQDSNHLPSTPIPLTPLENKLPLTPMPCLSHKVSDLSPKLAAHLNSTPFTTLQRH